MTDILRDTSPEALVAAIEANTCDAFVRWGEALGAEFHRDDTRLFFISGMPFQLGNGIVWLRTAEGDADALINDTLGRCRERNLPLAWLVGPSSRPGDLAARLEARRLTLDGTAPGMALPLANLRDDAAPVPGLTIKQVADGETLAQWIHTCAVGSGLPPEIEEVLHGLYTRHGLTPNTMPRFFLGRLDGAPVATSLLFASAGVAGIYCVAALPEARNRGIGAALTVAALRAAQDEGYAVAVLQSSDMGLNIYRRLGFREYCKLSIYFG